MDKASETAEEHFFGEKDVVVEELSPDNKDDFARYLLESERIDVRSENRDRIVAIKQSGTRNMKKKKQKRADKEAQRSVDDEDTYFLVVDRKRSNPIAGHALNVEEGRATEMRIDIFDEEYRGLRDEDGRSLYDLLTELRMDAAQGTPYVCNTNPKAQYSMENLELEDGGFEILKWSPVFKKEQEKGVLMAYADGQRSDEPENLYVPEAERDALSEFVEDTLGSFYGDHSTDISSETTFEDYDGYEGLQLERSPSARGKTCLEVTGGGDQKPQEIYDEIRDYKEGDTHDIEVRVDAEEPLALNVSEKLLDNHWLATGYVPDIGGEYDSHQLSYFFPKSAENYAVTEGVADHFDKFDIPYRKEDSEDEVSEMKSVPVEIGVLSRDVSPDRNMLYSRLW